MKRLIFVFTVLLGLAFTVSAQNHRFYPFRDKYKIVYRDLSKDTTSITGLVSNALDQTYYVTDSSFYFAPAVSFNVMKFNKTGAEATVLPGIGYGINYKPSGSTLDCSSLVSFNVFTNAGISITDEVNFVGSVSGMFGIWDNLVSVGAMYEFGGSCYMCVGTSFEF